LRKVKLIQKCLKKGFRILRPYGIGENDIKDGLIKMMLFSNIDKLYEETDINSKTPVNFIPVLRLTSEKIYGEITTNMKFCRSSMA